MSEYVSTHALERSIRELSTGGVLNLDARRAAAGYDQLQEIEAQIQIPIWGIAAAGAGWSKFEVAFDVQFMFAPEQRDSPLVTPHFSYGPVVSGVPYPVELTPDPNNPDNLVAVTCQIVEWGVDLAVGAIVGAVVGIGTSTLSGGSVKFNGYLHLTFQGYGSPLENTQSTAA